MPAAAVLYVKDLTTMRTFYETCFALSAEQLDDDGFCVLTSSEWELSLVCVSSSVAASIRITDPPQRREGSPVKLVFDVADLGAAESNVIAAGGQIDPDDAAWDFRGRRHRDCLDPEGNVVQLRQGSRP